jgi:FKBP12-rapamycin complex-associated protein
MLAGAVGPNLTKLLHDQLDLMLACGLSEPLRHALVAIARYIPPLLKTVQGKAPSHSHLAFLMLSRPSS